MDCHSHPITEMLEARVQFIIPLYQRHYSWEEKQCEQLWNDVITLTKNEDKSVAHFMGSFVDISTVNSSTGMKKYSVIDGQQRLTTVMILLIALRDYCKETFSTADNTYKRINEQILKNLYEEEVSCQKLLLLPEDALVLKKLIDNDSDDNEDCRESRLMTNYRYFKNKCELEKIAPNTLYQSIRSLYVVEITLSDKEDNAQEIFESLNSTGKNLAESDLIRNYILMNQTPEKQDHLYKTYWEKLEQYFKDPSKRETNMDEFFRAYLSMNLFTFVSKKSIYDSFKKLMSCSTSNTLSRDIHFNTIEDLCEDILLCAKWYSQINEQESQNNDIQSAYKGLEATNTTSLIPLFLLLNYYCYKTHAISETECAYVMQLCITYVYRRKICNFQTAGNNKYFCETLQYIVYCTNGKNMVHALEEEFAMQVAKDELPSDPQFIDNFTKAKLYTMGRKFCDYTLSQLEDFDNKNYTSRLTHSIEHIMPQNSHLNQQWREMLGKNWKNIQLNLLHTPGNLTLTNYNSEMSDQSFQDKYKTDYQQSPFTHLNEDVRNCSTWTEEQIVKRSQRLAELAVQVWAVPQVTEEIEEKALQRRAKEVTSSVTVKDALALDVTGKEPKDLIFKNSIYPSQKWRSISVKLFEFLYDENSNIINQFAAENPKLIHTTAGRTNDYPLGNTGFFTSGKSSTDTLRFIQRLLSFYDNKAGTDYESTTKFTIQ